MREIISSVCPGNDPVESITINTTPSVPTMYIYPPKNPNLETGRVFLTLDASTSLLTKSFSTHGKLDGSRIVFSKILSSSNILKVYKYVF